jgi:hypothetical protein
MSRQYLGSVDPLQQCGSNFSNTQQTSIFVDYGPAMGLRKSVQRVVIAFAGMLLAISDVGGTELLAQAHADNPDCVATATDSCPDHANLVKTDPPQRHLQTICQGAGMGGAHCFQRWVP